MSKATDYGPSPQTKQDLRGLVLFLAGLATGLLAMFWVSQRQEDECPLPSDYQLQGEWR